MAKVTITIEDMPNGKVKVECKPKVEQMLGLLDNGTGLTAAEGYAFSALRKLLKDSDENDKEYKGIVVPRFGSR